MRTRIGFLLGFLLFFPFSQVFCHGVAQLRAAEYRGLYDAILKAAQNLEVPNPEGEISPYLSYGKDKYPFNEVAFETVFRNALQIYKKGIQEDCASCDTHGVEETQKSRFRRWIDGAKEMGVEISGKSAELIRHRGLTAVLLGIPPLLILEVAEHSLLPIPPNPYTCGAIFAFSVGVVGFVQDALRLGSTRSVSLPLRDRLLSIVLVPYFRTKFWLRMRHLKDLRTGFRVSRKKFEKDLEEKGRELEEHLISTRFWKEVYRVVGENGRVQPALLAQDIDFLWGESSREEKIWRVEQHVNGLYLLRDFLIETINALKEESEDSNLPMPMSHYLSARGAIGSLNLLLDRYHNKLFFIALKKEKAPETLRLSLQTELGSLLSSFESAKGLFEWKGAFQLQVHKSARGAGGCVRELLAFGGDGLTWMVSKRRLGRACQELVIPDSVVVEENRDT